MGRHVQLTGFVMPEKLGASSTAMSLFESSQAARRLVTFVQVKQTLFDSSITGVGLNPFYIESCRGCAWLEAVRRMSYVPTSWTSCEYTVHSRRLGKGLSTCAATVQIREQGFMLAFTPLRFFAQWVCKPADWKPALTYPNCMSELIKDMLPESHHVCVHFCQRKNCVLTQEGCPDLTITDGAGWLRLYFCERCLLGLCYSLAVQLTRLGYTPIVLQPNTSRLRNGTAMFVCFLLCLEEIGLVRKEHKILVSSVYKIHVFSRTLQTLYWSVSVSVVWLMQYCIVFASQAEPPGSYVRDWMIIVFFHFIGRYGHFYVN